MKNDSPPVITEQVYLTIIWSISLLSALAITVTFVMMYKAESTKRYNILVEGIKACTDPEVRFRLSESLYIKTLDQSDVDHTQEAMIIMSHQGKQIEPLKEKDANNGK